MTINIPDNLSTPEAIEYAIRAQVAQAEYERSLREQVQNERRAERLRLFAEGRGLVAAA
jgi:hypothetical protein